MLPPGTEPLPQAWPASTLVDIQPRPISNRLNISRYQHILPRFKTRLTSRHLDILLKLKNRHIKTPTYFTEVQNQTYIKTPAHFTVSKPNIYQNTIIFYWFKTRLISIHQHILLVQNQAYIKTLAHFTEF